MAATTLGSLDENTYSSSVVRSSPPLDMAETSAENASVIGIMPPDDMEIDIRNIANRNTSPAARIILKRRFFTPTSLLSSSEGTMLSLIPLNPLRSVENAPFSGPRPLSSTIHAPL